MFKNKLTIAVACALYAIAHHQAYAANDIEIVSGSVEINITGGPSYTSTDDSAQLGIDNITTTWDASTVYTVNPSGFVLNLSSSEVTLSTSGFGTSSQNGDIRFTADLTQPAVYTGTYETFANTTRYFTKSLRHVLNLNAHNDINLNGIIAGGYASDISGFDYSNNGLVLNLSPDSDASNVGVVNLNGSISGNVHTTVNGALEIGATGGYSLDDHYLAASLTAESINVAAGGGFDFTGGHLTLTNSDLTIGAGGLLGESFAIEGNSSKVLTLANNGVLTIDAGADFTLESYGLEAGAIVNNGSFNYTGGTLALTNSGLTIGQDGLLGNVVNIGANHHIILANDNVLTIDAGANFTMHSGSLEVGAIVNNGVFNHGDQGLLRLTNSGITIGAGGLLGSDVHLQGFKGLSVSGDVVVEAGASLSVDEGVQYGNQLNYDSGYNFYSGAGGGDLKQNHFQADLNNQGTVTVFDSHPGALGEGELTVDGIITNDGGVAGLTINGGTLNAGAINNINGGSFTFNSGNLNLTNSGLTVGAAGLMGDNVNLSSDRSLAVSGNVDIEGGSAFATGGGDLTAGGNITVQAGATLAVDGGALSAGSISNSGTFDFTSGLLALTSSGLTIGNGGLLGSDVSLDWQRSLSVAGDVGIDSAASLGISYQHGGAHFSGNLNNQGAVVLSAHDEYDTRGGRLTVDGIITNDGAGASFDMGYGTLTAGGISNINGGSFNFINGRLVLTNSGLTVGAGGLLGNDVELSRWRLLEVAGDVEVDSGASLVVGSDDFTYSARRNRFLGNLNNRGSVVINDSGETSTTGALIVDGVITNDGAGSNLALDEALLTAGAINNVNGGSFDFVSGSLELTNSGLVVGNNGLMGGNVELATSSRVMSVAGDVTVDSGAALVVDSGMTSNAVKFRVNRFMGNLTNHGAVSVLNAPNPNDEFYRGELVVDGVITNDGVGANLILDGGILTAAGINTINGANFDFISGHLELTNSGVNVGSGGMLGGNVALNAARSLSAAGDVVIDSGATLLLDGGRLTAGSIDNTNGGSFNFNSGDLVLTRSMVIGVDGPLGSDTTLSSNKRLLLSNYELDYQAGVSGGQLTNAMLTIDTGSSFTVDGGTLVAGEINTAGEFNFNSGVVGLTSGRITVGTDGLLGSNVALTADRRLQLGFQNFPGSIVDASETITVAIDALGSGSTTLDIVGTMDVENSGQLTVTGDVVNHGTLNVATGGQVDVSGNVSNHGYGQVDIAAGGELAIQTGQGYTYTQDPGSLTTNVDGTLTADEVNILGGYLTGSGTINGNLTIDGGEYNPGNSPGAMKIVGDFVLTEAGTLHLEAALDTNGDLAWDQLIVGGNYDFQQSGTIQFSLLDGVDITSFGNDFTMADFFRAGDSDDNTAVDLASGIFDVVNILAHDESDSGWYSLDFDESGVFAATSIAPPPSSVVPVPAAIWLFSSGLIGLVGLARRKKA